MELLWRYYDVSSPQPLVSCLLRTCLLQSAGGDASAAAMATALTTDVRMEAPAEQELVIRSVAPSGGSHRELRCLQGDVLFDCLLFWFSRLATRAAFLSWSLLSDIDHHDVFLFCFLPFLSWHSLHSQFTTRWLWIFVIFLSDWYPPIYSSVAGLFTEGGSEAAPLLAAVVPVLAAMERQYPAPFDAALGGLEGGAHRRLTALRAALRGHVGGAG